MSHIDKAIRIWEGSSAVEDAAPETAAASGRSPLNQYAREGAALTDRSDRPHSVEEERAPLPAHKTAARVARLPAEADVRARLVTAGSNAVSLEQYRRLAAALHDAQVERGLKIVMLTSALPHEGKTLTIVNLALTLTESYQRRVLVIDADLRWPSLHAVLGVRNERGLSEALIDDGLDLPVTEVSSRLSVLTAGRPGPAPLAGLTSERMRALLEECGRRFDWVLLDTSPVGLLPDAQLLARLTGAVIVVIRAGSTPAAAVERAVADLGSDCVIGTVLNRVEEYRIPEAGYYARYKAAKDEG